MVIFAVMMTVVVINENLLHVFIIPVVTMLIVVVLLE